MPWSFNLDKAESLNDSAFRDLLIGTHTYTITSASMVANRQDPTGNELQLIFRLENDGISYPVFLQIMSANATQAAIANKTLKSISDACGIKGILTSERLKSFVNKVVSVTTRAKEDAHKTDPLTGKPIIRVNIQTVDAAGGEEPAGEPAAAKPKAKAPALTRQVVDDDAPSMDTPSERAPAAVATSPEREAADAALEVVAAAAPAPRPGKKPWET